MKHAMEDIVLQYTYPRLDSEVTKHRNHLLKAPFVIHPGTGMQVFHPYKLFNLLFRVFQLC
jgi:DNA primase catalytic subunit